MHVPVRARLSALVVSKLLSAKDTAAADNVIPSTDGTKGKDTPKGRAAVLSLLNVDNRRVASMVGQAKKTVQHTMND